MRNLFLPQTTFFANCSHIPEHRGVKDSHLVTRPFFIIANSVDPDEMLHYAAFHQGLHCLSKYLLAGFQNKKDFKLTLADPDSESVIAKSRKIKTQSESAIAIFRERIKAKTKI